MLLRFFYLHDFGCPLFLTTFTFFFSDSFQILVGSLDGGGGGWIWCVIFYFFLITVAGTNTNFGFVAELMFLGLLIPCSPLSFWRWLSSFSPFWGTSKIILALFRPLQYQIPVTLLYVLLPLNAYYTSLDKGSSDFLNLMVSSIACCLIKTSVCAS